METLIEDGVKVNRSVPERSKWQTGFRRQRSRRCNGRPMERLAKRRHPGRPCHRDRRLRSGGCPAARVYFDQRRCDGRGVRHVASEGFDVRSARAACLGDSGELRAIPAEAQPGRSLPSSKGVRARKALAQSSRGANAVRACSLPKAPPNWVRFAAAGAKTSTSCSRPIRLEPVRIVRKAQGEPTLCPVVGPRHCRIGFVSQQQDVLERVAPADILVSRVQGRVLASADPLHWLSYN